MARPFFTEIGKTILIYLPVGLLSFHRVFNYNCTVLWILVTVWAFFSFNFAHVKFLGSNL